MVKKMYMYCAEKNPISDYSFYKNCTYSFTDFFLIFLQDVNLDPRYDSTKSLNALLI